MTDLIKFNNINSGDDLLHVKELFIEYAKSLGVDLSLHSLKK